MVNADYALSVILTQNSDCIVLPYTMSYYRIHNKGLHSSLTDNKGLIKKAESLISTKNQMKYYFGSRVYLHLSKKNLIYTLVIIKRNIMSLNLIEVIKNIGIFSLLLLEYISSSILLHLQKKYKKKTD